MREDVAKKLGARSAWDDEETGLVKVLLTGGAFNSGGISTLADSEGNLITDLQFDYLADSSCGLFLVHVPGGKYGYVNVSGTFEFEPVYDGAERFSDDHAWVNRDGRLLILCRDGTEIEPEALPDGLSYARVEDFHEGRARFSTVHMGGFWGFASLAYHHDDAENAGIWGYVDTSGKIIVPPKYIFAEDYINGLAIVCEGEWTAGDRWNNRFNSGRYWSEKMLWGAIDRDGRVAIPCKFDEFKWRQWDSEWSFSEITKKYLAACDENRRWGLVDLHGNWVVSPKFGDIGYEMDVSPDCDMFVFYRRAIWGGGDPDMVPCGIYSISLQRVVVPAEKYVEIEFVDNDTITVRETANGEEMSIRLSSLPACEEGVLYEEWQEGMP